MTSQPQEKKVLENILRINIPINSTLLFPPIFTKKKPTLCRAVKDWIVWKRVKKNKEG